MKVFDIVNHTADVVIDYEGGTYRMFQSGFPVQMNGPGRYDDAEIADRDGFPGTRSRDVLPHVYTSSSAADANSQDAGVAELTRRSTHTTAARRFGVIIIDLRRLPGGLDDLFTENPRVLDGNDLRSTTNGSTSVSTDSGSTPPNVNLQFWQLDRH